MSVDRRESLGVGEAISLEKGMADLERRLNERGPYRRIGKGESFHPKGPFFEIALLTSRNDDTVAIPNSGREEYERFICGLYGKKPVALGTKGKMVPFKLDSAGVGLNLTFGRGKDANLPMVNRAVSREHGVVWWREDEGFSVISLSEGKKTYCREISRDDVVEWSKLTEVTQEKGGETKQERKSEKRRREEREKSPLATYERIVIDGRSGEDKTSVALEKTLRNNKWGINFIGGVFDGHSLKKTAGPLAQKALPIFWKHLEETQGEDLREAIEVAAVAADEEIIRKFKGEDGTCVEVVITTGEGVYLVHIGDGQAFLQNGRGEIRSVGLPPHKPAEGGRVAGRLAVNRSWGDGKIKRMVSQEDLSPVPTVKFFEWEKLKEGGVEKLLVTTDGLLDLVKYGDFDLGGALEFGLGTEFKDAVRESKKDFVDLVARTGGSVKVDDVSALLLTFDFNH